MPVCLSCAVGRGCGSQAGLEYEAQGGREVPGRQGAVKGWERWGGWPLEGRRSATSFAWPLVRDAACQALLCQTPRHFGFVFRKDPFFSGGGVVVY